MELNHQSNRTQLTHSDDTAMTRQQKTTTTTTTTTNTTNNKQRREASFIGTSHLCSTMDEEMQLPAIAVAATPAATTAAEGLTAEPEGGREPDGAATAITEAPLKKLSAAAATQHQLPEQPPPTAVVTIETPAGLPPLILPRPAIDPESLHPFLEATTAQDLSEFMQVPLRALGCVELMEHQKCTAKDCPYPAAYRTASGNKNGTFPKCVLHNQQWYPKPPRKAHFLLGHEFLRPQIKESSTTSVVSQSTNDTTPNQKPKLPPCCWHCCCGDDYCKGIGYTPHARSIPVRHVEGVLEALPWQNSAVQQKIRLHPKNFSVAPWHFHPNARVLDANGRWKLKPLDATLVYAHATGERIPVDNKNHNQKNKHDRHDNDGNNNNNNNNNNNDLNGDWDGEHRWRGERVWRGFPPPTYDIRKFVELEVLPQLAIGGTGENSSSSNNNNSITQKNDLPLWAVEMAKADIQHIRSKLPPEFFQKPKKKRRGPKRKVPGADAGGSCETAPMSGGSDNLETKVKQQAKRIHQLEKGWDRNDRIIQELRAENAALKAKHRNDGSH